MTLYYFLQFTTIRKLTQSILKWTDFWQVFLFYTPSKHQKTRNGNIGQKWFNETTVYHMLHAHQSTQKQSAICQYIATYRDLRITSGDREGKLMSWNLLDIFLRKVIFNCIYLLRPAKLCQKYPDSCRNLKSKLIRNTFSNSAGPVGFPPESFIVTSHKYLKNLRKSMVTHANTFWGITSARAAIDCDRSRIPHYLLLATNLVSKITDRLCWIWKCISFDFWPHISDDDSMNLKIPQNCSKRGFMVRQLI